MGSGVAWNQPTRRKPIDRPGGKGGPTAHWLAAGGRVELRSRWPGKQRIRRDRIARDERRPSTPNPSWHHPPFLRRAPPAPQSARIRLAAFGRRRAWATTAPPPRGLGHLGAPSRDATCCARRGSSCAGQAPLAGSAAAPRRGPPLRAPRSSRGTYRRGALHMHGNIPPREGTERRAACDACRPRTAP